MIRIFFLLKANCFVNNTSLHRPYLIPHFCFTIILAPLECSFVFSSAMLLQHVATTFLRLLLCDVYHHTLSIMCLNKRDRYEIHHQLIETCFGLRGNLEFPDVLRESSRFSNINYSP